MLGWFRRRSEKVIDDAAALEAEFDEVMRKVDSFDDRLRATVAYGVAFSWRIFVASYPTAERFQDEPLSKQMEFVDKLTQLENYFKSKQSELGLAAVGAALTRMYLAPLIERNAAMGNRMADRLERLNREGFSLLK